MEELSSTTDGWSTVEGIEVIDGQFDSADEAGRVNPEQAVNDEFRLGHSVEAEQFPGFRRQLEDAQKDACADAVRVASHQRPRRADSLLVVTSQL